MRHALGVSALPFTIVAALTLAHSTPTEACQYVPGARLLPESNRPSTLPVDASFSFLVGEGELGTTNVEISLATDEQSPVELEPPKKWSTSWESEYWTVTPVDALSPGDYVLTATPSSQPTSDSSSEVFEFTVADDHEHPDFPLVDITLSTEKTNNPSPCHGGVWRGSVEVQGDELMPQIAYFVTEFEMRDGATITRGSSPRWGSVDGTSWDTDISTVRVVEPFDSRAECVTMTAVLATGEQVELPRSCEQAVGCGACASVASRPGIPQGLLAVLALVLVAAVRGLRLGKAEPFTPG